MIDVFNIKLKHLMQEFQVLLETLNDPPPSRPNFDHKIEMLPNAQVPAGRVYKLNSLLNSKSSNGNYKTIYPKIGYESHNLCTLLPFSSQEKRMDNWECVLIIVNLIVIQNVLNFHYPTSTRYWTLYENRKSSPLLIWLKDVIKVVFTNRISTKRPSNPNSDSLNSPLFLSD